MKMQLSEKTLFGVRVTTSSEEDILKYVMDILTTSSKKLSVFTPNPEIVVKAAKDKAYLTILNSGSILLPDGAGLILASWLLASPLEHRITGVDFMVHFLARLDQSELSKRVTVGFLGAKPNVALQTAECLQKRYPHMRVSFIGEEWPASQQGEDSGVFIPTHYQLKIADSAFGNMTELKNAIKHSYSGNKTGMKGSEKIDLLFVAFGAPKQERWIASNLPNLPIQAAIGVGGAFDFISGQVTRAPLLMRTLGLEWLYRLMQEPWRWKRQLALLTFIKIVTQEYLLLIKSSFKTNK